MVSLSLRPLWRLPRLLETELAAFFGTRVAFEESGFLEFLSKFGIVFHESPGNTVSKRFRLTGESSTANSCGDLEFNRKLGLCDGIDSYAALLVSFEIRVNVLVVDGNGLLASASATTTVVINPESVTLEHWTDLSYYFNWLCSSGTPDRLQMLFKAVSAGAGEANLTNDYDLTVIMRNSGQ